MARSNEGSPKPLVDSEPVRQGAGRGTSHPAKTWEGRLSRRHGKRSVSYGVGATGSDTKESDHPRRRARRPRALTPWLPPYPDQTPESRVEIARMPVGHQWPEPSMRRTRARGMAEKDLQPRLDDGREMMFARAPMLSFSADILQREGPRLSVEGEGAGDCERGPA